MRSCVCSHVCIVCVCSQDKLWSCLRSACDALATSALSIWHLQRVVAKKRDPISHVLFLDVVCPPGTSLLTERFWWVRGDRLKWGLSLGRCGCVATCRPPATHPLPPASAHQHVCRFFVCLRVRMYMLYTGVRCGCCPRCLLLLPLSHYYWVTPLLTHRRTLCLFVSNSASPV